MTHLLSKTVKRVPQLFISDFELRTLNLIMRGLPKLAYLCTLLLLTSLLSSPAQQTRQANGSPWESMIVTIEIARNQYDYTQPWTRKTRRLKKTGIVVAPRQVLTTADQLFDRTLVRLQKQGRGQWAIAQVSWIDYPANLALVTTEEADFWADLKPATVEGALPANGNLQIVRWREGNLENRRAEFNQFSVREWPLSPINMASLEVSTEMQNAGWGEPIVADSRVVGLLMSQEGRNCSAIPGSFIKSVLDARQKGQFRGLGFFHFYWQPAENPASLAALKLPGAPRGVLVHFVPDRPDDFEQVMRTNDIILNIDGFPIDMEGYYLDPEYGRLIVENLAVRNKWAGDDVKMKVWRDGQELDVTYRLPKYDYTNSLLPFATFDQPPEYLIAGGLVFQPLTGSYLQTWGADWKRRAPFRLNYYSNQFPTKERPSYVIMSQVLPDPFNIGYQELRYLVVDKVNDQLITNLAQLRDALKKPLNGFHLIEFVKTDGLRRVVIAAGDEEAAATDRILKRYGITTSFALAATAPAAK